MIRSPAPRRALAEMVAAGWDIVAPIPSCALMFKQELPLMFPVAGLSYELIKYD